MEHEGAYLRKAVVNELGRTSRRQAARRLAETRWAWDAIRDRPRDSVADTYEHACESDGVTQCLTTLPDRRRQVLEWLYLAQVAGWRPADIARELRLRPATIRCQRRHARRDLTPFLFGAEHEHRRWLRHGQRVHETFGDGVGGRALPRPVIADGWTRLRAGGLKPDRGTLVELVDPDELRQRRAPAGAGWPVIAAMIDLAARNDLPAVVVDADQVVLHRGGHRGAMAAADRVGFVEGARWDLAHAGLTAVGLARALGAPATVNRWEHYFPDQHGLCCVAIPAPVEGGRHITHA
ncbi:hypothetical protein [Saccharothrix xinjiangensis]|uniref:Sigma-70-like protein n=1 Tax=Saccharothrix xinjiangensis TaxID=204798 RepID=A0ABV9Y4S1_9PSEU